MKKLLNFVNWPKNKTYIIIGLALLFVILFFIFRPRFKGNSEKVKQIEKDLKKDSITYELIYKQKYDSLLQIYQSDIEIKEDEKRIRVLHEKLREKGINDPQYDSLLKRIHAGGRKHLRKRSR